jgi:hypothetical protein
MSLLEAYEQLGNQVELAWARCNYDEDRFPELARAALLEFQGEFTIEQLVDEVLRASSGRLLPQHDIQSTFGEPPLTVFTGRRFYIAINFWVNASIAIHEHGFCGAFRVLQGSSFHARYSFEAKTVLNSHLKVGSVHPGKMELLQPGDVSIIGRGDAGAHRLFHIERPSATLVVRTRGEAGVTQYTYLPPAIAYDPFFLGTPEDPVSWRRHELLRLLGVTNFDALKPRLFEYLRGSELSTAFEATLSLIKVVVDRADDPSEFQGALGEIAGVVAERDAEFARALRDSVSELLWSTNILHRREMLRGLDERYLFAVLLNAPDRGTVLDWVRRRWPDQHPMDRVLAVLDKLAGQKDPEEQGLTMLGLEPDAASVLREMVVSPGSFDDVRTRLRARWRGDVVDASQNELRSLYHSLIVLSPFRPLIDPTRT